MANQLFSNNASTTLSGSLSQGGTTLTVATGEGALFPSITGGDFFIVTLFEKDIGSVEWRHEAVKVTGRTADTFTIERDLESMTGNAGGYAYPSVGGETVYIELRLTAYGCAGMLQEGDNLASLGSASTARTNLGLGGAAVLAVGTGAGDVAAGNHTHTGLYEPADATILKNAAIGVSVAAQSHSHSYGDASTNTATSVDSEIAIFSSTGGKTLKRATTTGLLKGTSGVLSAATVRTDYAEPTTALATGILKNTTSTGAHTIAAAGTDYVSPTGTESLTNKTIGMAGALDCNNNVIQEIKTATFNSQTTIATTTGSVTVDWTSAQNQKQTEPTGTITYTFTAPPGACHLQLLIDSDGTSTAQSFTWPGTVIWVGATWTATANKKAVINFWYDGTSYYAMGANQV